MRVILYRNGQWRPNLVRRTLDQSEVQCLGQRSYMGQPKSTRDQIDQECPMVTNLVGRTPKQSVVVKGHAGVKQGQPGVKLLGNTLWLPSLVERNPDRIILQCWGRRSCGVRWGSTGGKIAWNCPIVTDGG